MSNIEIHHIRVIVSVWAVKLAKLSSVTARSGQEITWFPSVPDGNIANTIHLGEAYKLKPNHHPRL
jgi:hypothetical protein